MPPSPHDVWCNSIGADEEHFMMNSLMVLVDSRLDLFQQSFSGGTSLPDINLPWAWMLAGVGTLLAMVAIWSQLQRDRSACGPTTRHLCTAMALSNRQRRMLYRLGRAAQVESPASLMISRGGFEYAALRYARRHGRASAIEDLRRQIFAD